MRSRHVPLALKSLASSYGCCFVCLTNFAFCCLSFARYISIFPSSVGVIFGVIFSSDGCVALFTRKTPAATMLAAWWSWSTQFSVPCPEWIPMPVPQAYSSTRHIRAGSFPGKPKIWNRRIWSISVTKCVKM
jgi:hypothetical protein